MQKLHKGQWAGYGRAVGLRTAPPLCALPKRAADGLRWVRAMAEHYEFNSFLCIISLGYSHM
jgi:hypothetical protein